MTHHFYDLEKLMHTPYAEIALNDSVLYSEIVEHRRKFYHVGYVDYGKELPANIQIVPSDEQMSAYEADYNEMKERASFVCYGILFLKSALPVVRLRVIMNFYVDFYYQNIILPGNQLFTYDVSHDVSMML